MTMLTLEQKNYGNEAMKLEYLTAADCRREWKKVRKRKPPCVNCTDQQIEECIMEPMRSKTVVVYCRKAKQRTGEEITDERSLYYPYHMNNSEVRDSVIKEMQRLSIMGMRVIGVAAYERYYIQECKKFKKYQNTGGASYGS